MIDTVRQLGKILWVDGRGIRLLFGRRDFSAVDRKHYLGDTSGVLNIGLDLRGISNGVPVFRLGYRGGRVAFGLSSEVVRSSAANDAEHRDKAENAGDEQQVL